MAVRKTARKSSKPARIQESPVVVATEVAGVGALVVLLAALLLAGYNLTLAIGKSGSLSGLEKSMQTLESNYSAAYETQEPEPPAKPMPPVLWSVVRFRAGEQEDLNMRLVGPLLARSMESGPALSALLIERRNAGSRDVLVREFRVDGSEETYLWPSTHADAAGYWQAEE